MSATSNADFVSTYELIVLGNHATYAATALVCYEHFLTFKDEIHFIWKRKWNAATWIFAFNRYLLLANILFQVAPTVPQICNESRIMNILFFFTAGELSLLPTHAFTILRTFALLQDHSWRFGVTCALIALALTVVTLNSYQIFTGAWVSIYDPVLGSWSCDETGYSVSANIIDRVTTAAAVINIIAASFVLCITLMRTVRQVQQASMLGLKTTLSEVLMRDGSLFFFIILLQNIILALPILNESLLDKPSRSIIAPFFNVLLPVLLARFIINLRQIDSPKTNTSANQQFSRFSMPNFHIPTMDDVVGNLGEPLDFAECRSDDEDGDMDTGANAERQDTAGRYSTTRVVEIEAAGISGSGSGVADAVILGIDSGELEELRLGPVFLV